jgi:hypothetical protein
MKVLEFLKKNFVSGLVTAITVDSYRRTVYSHERDIRVMKLKNLAEIDNLKEQHNLDKEQLTEEIKDRLNTKFQDELKNKEATEEMKKDLLDISKKYNELQEDSTVLESKLTKVNSKLENGKFDKDETVESLTNLKNSYSTKLNELNEQKDIYVDKILDVINQSDTKSNVFDFLSDFIVNFQSIVDQLGLEQLVAIFNIVGFCTVIVNLNNISILLIGDYLIEKLNLEVKYPKLTKLIRIKQKLNKGFLTFYLAFLYLLLIIYILGNIYMLVLKYFVN